jgi:hypothetical protein
VVDDLQIISAVAREVGDSHHATDKGTSASILLHFVCKGR